MPFGIGKKRLSKRDSSVAAVVFSALLVFLVIDLIRKLKQGEAIEDLVGHIIVMVAIAVVDWGMIANALAKEPAEEEAVPEEISEIEDIEEAEVVEEVEQDEETAE